LTFDLLTLKAVSESHVTWPTSVPILVFLGFSVLDLVTMYATDRQTSDAHHRLMPLPRGRGGGITMQQPNALHGDCALLYRHCHSLEQLCRLANKDEDLRSLTIHYILNDT